MGSHDESAKIVSDKKELRLIHKYYYYKGAAGNNMEFSNRSSGAYIFRPNGTNAIVTGKNIKIKHYSGPVVDELHVTYSSWVSEIIRIYKNDQHAEFNWLVGPIPIDDHVGKEVVSRFTTPLKTKSVFYTDSNGREILKRKRNYRPTWTLSLEESISGNYYPVTSKISIKDDDLQFTVLNDRAQGGSSLHDGEVELMVHRRLLHDDAFGVGEALNEIAFNTGLVVRGNHFLTVGNRTKQNAIERLLAQQQILDVWTFLTPAPHTTFDEWKTNNNMEFSGLTQSLPENVQILTLEPWKGRSFLIRLEHIFEKHESEELSKPVSVNLQNLFSPFNITSIQETTLGANQYLKDMHRLKWNYESNSVHQNGDSKADHENTSDFSTSSTITLAPMEIRTFIVDVKFSS